MPLYRAPATGGASTPPDGYYAPAVTGRWYRPATHKDGAVGDQTLARMYARPIPLATGTIDRIAAWVSGNTTASEVCRLGIYTNNETTGRPDTLVVDGGTIDLSASGNQSKAVTVSAAVTEGIHWLVAVRQGPTATTSMGVFTGSTESLNWTGYTQLLGGDPPDPWNNTSAAMQFVYIDSITGALPDPFGSATALGASATCPFVSVRYA